LVDDLMAARRAVALAKRAGDNAAVDAAHAEVDKVKVLLGERGPPWWTDGGSDLSRKMARATCYAEWYNRLFPDRLT
jgi:hypothetical protein